MPNLHHTHYSFLGINGYDGLPDHRLLYKFARPSGEKVRDGEEDIASTVKGPRMRIEAPGRVPYRMVYLEVTNRRKPRRNYDESTGEGVCQTHRLPSSSEFVCEDRTHLFLEVGLIRHDDWRLGKQRAPVGTRNYVLREREALPRDPLALRVFTPAKEEMPQLTVFYAGLSNGYGHLFAELVSAASVFFYPEYVGDTVWYSQAERQRRIRENCHMALVVMKEAATSSVDQLENEKKVVPDLCFGSSTSGSAPRALGNTEDSIPEGMAGSSGEYVERERKEQRARYWNNILNSSGEGNEGEVKERRAGHWDDTLNSSGESSEGEYEYEDEDEGEDEDDDEAEDEYEAQRVSLYATAIRNDEGPSSRRYSPEGTYSGFEASNNVEYPSPEWTAINRGERAKAKQKEQRASSGWMAINDGEGAEASPKKQRTRY